MEGKNRLNMLSDSLKALIAERYGSVDQFYDMVYKAGEEYYNAFVIEKNDNKKEGLEKYRFKIAMELEAMADSLGKTIDGFEIYDAIWGDFDEGLVKGKYGSLL